MSVLSRLTPDGPSGFGANTTAEDVTRTSSLTGKTYLLTGIGSGLGQETLRVLTLRGARVLGTARTLDKARQACAAVGPLAVPLVCELADPASVRACVQAVKAEGSRLDGLICNAGIMALPTLQKAHGFELQFFTNHIGHFILVTGLLERLGDAGRVVMLSSSAHRNAPKEGIQFDNLSGDKGYSAWGNYGQSKLANILFSNELARRLEGTGKTSNAVHPGVISTNLSRHMNPVVRSLFGALGPPLFLKSVGQGAATQTYVATHPSLGTVSGKYFADCNLQAPRADALDAELARRLWSTSEEVVAKL
jgi:WW domain-containing oxidoreductase